MFKSAVRKESRNTLPESDRQPKQPKVKPLSAPSLSVQITDPYSAILLVCCDKRIARPWLGPPWTLVLTSVNCGLRVHSGQSPTNCHPCSFHPTKRMSRGKEKHRPLKMGLAGCDDIDISRPRRHRLCGSERSKKSRRSSNFTHVEQDTDSHDTHMLCIGGSGLLPSLPST